MHRAYSLQQVKNKTIMNLKYILRKVQNQIVFPFFTAESKEGTIYLPCLYVYRAIQG